MIISTEGEPNSMVQCNVMHKSNAMYKCNGVVGHVLNKMSTIAEPMYTFIEIKLQHRNWWHHGPCTHNHDRHRDGVHIYQAELRDKTQRLNRFCIEIS